MMRKNQALVHRLGNDVYRVFWTAVYQIFKNSFVFGLCITFRDGENFNCRISGPYKGTANHAPCQISYIL